jgi:hypothetical protein
MNDERTVSSPNLYSVIDEVELEIYKSMMKFPLWPTDPIHAFAVVVEECGECQKEILQLVYEPHKSSKDDMRKEALHTAAMSIRFLMSIDSYEYKAGSQHQTN